MNTLVRKVHTYTAMAKAGLKRFLEKPSPMKLLVLASYCCCLCVELAPCGYGCIINRYYIEKGKSKNVLVSCAQSCSRLRKGIR